MCFFVDQKRADEIWLSLVGADMCILNQFTPPLLVMFFVLSGMRLSLPSLISAGFVGVIYFLVRIVGKYLAPPWAPW